MICQTCSGWGFVNNRPARPARGVCHECKGKAADIIPGDRGKKFRICDDSGIRFTKSARALYATRAAADAAMQRLLSRKA